MHHLHRTRHRSLYVPTLFAALALAACATEQGTNAPATPTGVSRSLSASVAAPSCNLSAARVHAASYFVARDPVFERITAMQRAYATGGAVGATNAGFDVLQRVSTVQGQTGPVIGTPAAGNVFVTDILACMSVGTLPAGFTAEPSLGPNGMFFVLGGPTDPQGPVTSRALPTYGAEPQSGQTWLGSAGRRFLLYGSDRDYSFTPETPAAITAYELSTVPAAIGFAPAIAAGVCQTTVANSLLQHVNIILALHPLSFCTGTFAARPAFAAAAIGGAGSLLSSLSPMGPVTFVPADCDLTFVRQPTDVSRNAFPQFVPPIAVSVGTVNGTPINGVLVTLTVYDSQGKVVPSGRNTAYTDGIGVALFPEFHISQPGRFTIVASGTVFGAATKTATSTSATILER